MSDLIHLITAAINRKRSIQLDYGDKKVFLSPSSSYRHLTGKGCDYIETADGETLTLHNLSLAKQIEIS